MVIEILHGLTGCPRQIMWGSAGYAAAYLSDEISGDAHLARRVVEDRAAYLGQEDAPLWQSTRYDHPRIDDVERALLIRRTCCLWYRVRPDDLCFYCPLLKAADRIETLRKLGLD